MRDLVADATRLATAIRLGRYPGLMEAERGRCIICRSFERGRRFAIEHAEWCSAPMCLACLAKTWKRSQMMIRQGRVAEEERR